MFENLQDTTILQNAMVSVVSLLKDELIKEREIELEDTEEALRALRSLLRTLHYKYEGASEKERKCPPVDQRCHAALFFTVLRSCGIHCSEADSYYETIYHSYPTMDLRLYLRLSLELQWSDYFVECAIQLPFQCLENLLTKIKNVPWDSTQNAFKYHSFHMVLQAVIWKLLIPEKDSSTQLDSNGNALHCFNFPFKFIPLSSAPNYFDETETPDHVIRMDLLKPYLNVLNELLNVPRSAANFLKISEVVLHGCKSIFKLMTKLEKSPTADIWELFTIFDVLNNFCCDVKHVKEEVSLHLDMQENGSFHKRILHATAWGIPINYLIFVTLNYWDDLKVVARESINLSSVLSKLPTNRFKKVLMTVCPFYKEVFGKDDGTATTLLRNIISFKLPFYSRAASVLLRHPEILEQELYLSCLEDQADYLSPGEIYKDLAVAIVKAQSSDSKNKLLNVFFRAFSSASDTTYKNALEYILNKYGFSEHFKTADFEEKLTQFVWKVMSLEEAKKTLLPLFVQSSATLNTLIEQALRRGSEGITVLQVFKCVPIVCTYKDYLVEVLSHYFVKSDLEVYEKKNMLLLIKTMMDIQTQEHIISFELFLKDCIFPNLPSDDNSKLMLNLECLQASLDILISKGALKMSLESLLTLIKHIAHIIDSSINLGNGNIKELALNIIFLLSKYKKDSSELNLEAELTSFHKVTQFYMFRYFCDESFNVRELLLVWWKYMSKLKLLGEPTTLKHVYADSLYVLPSLLSHFTTDEWIEMSRLLVYYFKADFSEENLEKPDFPWLLPESDPVCYAVIRCLLDSYNLAMYKGVGDIHYFTSCFTHTLMDFLSQEVRHPQTLVNVFLDSCHLVSQCETTEVLPALSSYLILLSEKIRQICKRKKMRKSCLTLMNLGVKSLSNVPINISSIL